MLVKPPYRLAQERRIPTIVVVMKHDVLTARRAEPCVGCATPAVWQVAFDYRDVPDRGLSHDTVNLSPIAIVIHDHDVPRGIFLSCNICEGSAQESRTILRPDHHSYTL